MAESGLPYGKTFATFDFGAVPTIRRAHVMALAAGDTWLEQSGNLLIFGGSGNREDASGSGDRYRGRRQRPAGAVLTRRCRTRGHRWGALEVAISAKIAS